MRGQAFLVFADLAGATAAMRACAGMTFYDKPLRISYAKTKSHATSKREDPNFVPPNVAHAGPLSEFNSKFASGVSLSEKRPREDDGATGREAKREKQQDSDEEMELEDDDDETAPAPKDTVPPATQQVSAQLLCTNLPQEVTDDVLSVLFQQYRGLQSVRVATSPTSNAAGQPVKMAQIFYETPQLAAVAKENLDGFALKKGWVMSVSYA